MKTKALCISVMAGLIALTPFTRAGRISEPGTTLYGRVVSRLGDREFLLEAGDLEWTIVVPAQSNREYTFKTRLQPLADGRYSYKLTLPHEALAFDLAVGEKTVPLTASGWQIKHLRVVVDGKPATLSAPATDQFTAGQATRAAAYRIDLVIAEAAADSDGDGMPDWWEDQHGTDKWNPNDAPGRVGGGAPGNTNGEFTGHTFVEWREHFFPGATGDLQTFGQQDPDGDGVSNLVEYAFEMNPGSTQDSPGRLPQARLVDGRMGVVFGKRLSATDIDYQVEVSGDMMHWNGDAASFENVTLSETEAAAGQNCVCVRSAANDARAGFLRVRVALKP